MLTTSANNKRIAKNTILLYFRTFITMVISLYTSRIVLNVLGVTDYGIYNVVGGIVAMFGFLNASMSISTQRYLNIEIGRKNFKRLNKVFITSINIHIIISLLIIFLGETIGLWLLYNKMTIPDNRFISALWVYQCAILSTIVMIISVPYNALIIAHERMEAFAYISILEVTLKLVAVLILFFVKYDNLIVYSILMLIMQLIIRLVYSLYCKRFFQESKFNLFWDRSLFKDMCSFAGWSLWGNIAFIGFTQGLNVLLNMFFCPIVNAARGISVQIQNAVNQFSSSFQMAINPQITKSYAVNDLNYMHSLIIRSSKWTFFLMLILSAPLLLETSFILKIWLGFVPDYTVTFTRLMLCVTIIDSIANPLITAATATGRIRTYQIVVGGLLLLIIPISYFVLKSGGKPWSVFIVHILMCTISFFVRLLFVHRMIGLSLKAYFFNVVFICVKITFLFVFLTFIFKLYVFEGQNFSIRLISDVMIILILVCIIYFSGLTPNEKIFIKNKIISILRSK